MGENESSDNGNGSYPFPPGRGSRSGNGTFGSCMVVVGGVRLCPPLRKESHCRGDTIPDNRELNSGGGSVIFSGQCHGRRSEQERCGRGRLQLSRSCHPTHRLPMSQWKEVGEIPRFPFSPGRAGDGLFGRFAATGQIGHVFSPSRLHNQRDYAPEHLADVESSVVHS